MSMNQSDKSYIEKEPPAIAIKRLIAGAMSFLSVFGGEI